MALVMKGIEVAKAMKEELVKEVERLKGRGIYPNLTIIRVGARPDDLAYERGALKRMEITGINCQVVELPEDISQESFEEVFSKVNDDESVHGILLFQPLPKHLNVEPIKKNIYPWKDVDCMSPVNVAKVFSGDKTAFAPCTAEAVVEMLKHFEVSLTGKNVVIVGRSMVVGKPLSMLLLSENATVTICHTKTKDLEEVCKKADILVAAAGKAEMIKAVMVGEDAIVADVGINVNAEGKLCGDVDYESVFDKVSMISPVPGGVGSITTSILAKHVIRSVKYLNE